MMPQVQLFWKLTGQWLQLHGEPWPPQKLCRCDGIVFCPMQPIQVRCAERIDMSMRLQAADPSYGTKLFANRQGELLEVPLQSPESSSGKRA